MEKMPLHHQKHLHNRKKQGFTLVEVLVVVVVLVVLAGIITVVSIGIQQDSRDKARKASATVVAESLEKYFKDNNEYPPVTAIASPTGLPIGDVKSKLGITSSDTLVFPLAQDTTKASIVTGTPSTKQMQYTGNCTTDACNDFTLSYVEEKTGNTVTIKSRAVASNNPTPPTDYNELSAPTAPSVSGSLAANNTTVTLTASGSVCNKGEVQYDIRYAASAAALGSTPWPNQWSSTEPTTKTFTGARGTTYYFNARARCVLNSVNSQITNSTNGSIVVPPVPTTPAAPSVTAPGVGGGTWTWTTPTCNVGTVNFQFNSIKSGDGAWATSYTTSTSAWYGPTSEEGSDYVVIVRAQCVNGSEQSGWSGDGSASVGVPVTSYTVVNNGYSSLYASGNAIYGLSQVYSTTGCPVGTVPVYFQQIDLNDPDDGSQAAGPSGRNRIHSGWGAGTVAYYLADLDGNNANATLNDKLEFMWYTRCQNIYTGRYGPQRYSDIFGNVRVVENRNVSNGKNGRWDRTCVGGAVDWPASDTVCGAGGPWGF